MPVYNAEKYLRESIDSIVDQTYTDWELVIINDGSTDSTQNIILSYNDDRIKYFENEKNMGVTKTLNKGIGLCKGNYIARFDADDVVHPNRLEAQVKFLDTHPNHIICGTAGVVVNEQDEVLRKLRTISFDEGIKIKLLFSSPLSHPSVMIRKKILEQNPYSEDWKYIEDFELWQRIAPLGKFANINKPYLRYRWHQENISVLRESQQVKSRDKIITEQLEKMGISPSAEDLKWHHLTFDYEAMSKSNNTIEDHVFDNAELWFNRLNEQNAKLHIYPKDYFIAFLWFRWIILCVKQKRFGKIIFPAFSSYRPSVIMKIFKFLG